MILLSWPPRELAPNGRYHFHAKASAAKLYRNSAMFTALGEGPQIGPERPLSVSVEFCPPDARKRDLDNMLASIKAGLDGISDAYGLNDYDLNPITIKRCDPVKGGRVIVRFSHDAS